MFQAEKGKTGELGLDITYVSGSLAHKSMADGGGRVMVKKTERG